MKIVFPSLLCLLAATLVPRPALAVRSGELYTAAPYPYGRFEARIRFAPGDGVVGAYFLWKDGSEISGTFWNELDFEKVGADCHLESNAFFGNPASVHVQKLTSAPSPCDDFHIYTYEWTPEYITWSVDGVELRRETGATAAAYADNASGGMQIRFNVWPGDATFGGNFSPSILPVYQHVDWVQYSSYADGAFTLSWRDDFDGPALDARWATGSWPSPKNLSTHDIRNVGIVDGMAVLALTTDEATGTGAMPPQGGGGSTGMPTGGTPAAPQGGSTAGGGAAGPADDSGEDGGCMIANAPLRGASAWLAVLGAAAASMLARRRARLAKPRR